ncbi:complement C3-like, partial [Paramuricea clavata]
QPGLLKIKVNAKDLHDQKSLDKQYVYLKASSSTPGFQFNNEIKVLVSYQNSMVFIQTDKPIYNPGQTVNLRVVPLGLDLKASMNNVTIEVLNPQGIRVERWGNLNTNEGFFSRRLDLSDNVMLGMWTISALYGHGLVQNASIQFEVREYVLPTFSVKIERPPYILENDPSFTIKVISKYTYGKPVLGTVRMDLAVLDDAGKAERFSMSVHPLRNGEADVTISTDLLKQHPKIVWFPDGKRLFIEAKVIEQATGQEEKALDNTVYFTNTPLKISFKRSPRFFKPGVPFEIKVDVSYPSGKPAKNIDLEIDAKTNDGTAVLERVAGGKASGDTTNQLGHGRFVVDVPRTFTISFLDIKVKAKINKGGQDIISQGRFQPKMYQSSGNNYLFVRFLTKPRVGQSVDGEAFVLSSGQPSSLTYMVVANGRIINQGTIARNLGVLTTIRILVTSAMSPQARFVAYYRVNNELVVDSAILEVEEELPNQVSFLGDQHPQKIPGDSHKIEIQSSPHSKVGILAVDQSVYLLRNDKHLTSDEVYKRMKSHDLGCGSGAGQNNKDVLNRGGLAVMTTINNIKTDTRPDYSCAAGARRKRRNAVVVVDPQCCQLGEKVDAGTCQARAMNFSISNQSSSFHPRDDCVIQFYKCCYKRFEMDVRQRSGDVDVPNNLLNGLGLDQDPELLKLLLEEAQLRTNFPEKWLYEDGKAGKDGRVSFRVTVPDTITTWVMQAIAVSNTTGFGLTPPFNLRAFKPFFVSIKLPYSAQRGEQVSVIATVFNYKNTAEMVSVYLFKRDGDDYCTYSNFGAGSSLYKVRVDANGAASVSFPVVPTEVGDIPIQVRIISSNGDGDGEQRRLKVLPEGMERQQTHSVVLDPLDVLRDPADAKPSAASTTPSKIQTSTKGNGIQKNRLSLRLPGSTVPESEYAVLKVIGNLIGPAVSSIIEGRGLDSIIKLPTGCGEQTMLKLAPNVFVLNYLRSTKQVTQQIEQTAFNFIRSGYQRELNYRRSDHSFSAFGNSRPGSTWLTAFVIKTFCAIQKLDGIDIDQNVINTAINWLASRQRADGAIPESNPVVHQEMDGDINSDITMTAYVVTTFLECKSFTANSVQTVKNAVAYLENMQPNVGRVYVKAVIAYALALANSPLKLNANQDLLNSARYDAGKNTRYWHDGQGGNAIDVETTSYALLTQMALQRRGYAGPIVVWLTEQRKGGGGFISTQDTCVALQALAAYSEATGGDQLNLRIEITTDREYKKTLMINQKNALVQQQLDITNLIGDELFIQTKGSGVAQLQVETQYNTPPTKQEVCQFDLSVSTIERVRRFHDQPILVVPKPTKAPKKRKPKAKGRRNKKCRRKNGRRCKRCKGRRCNRRRNKPKPTTPARPVSTRALPNDAPAPNSVSIKICA